MKKLYNILMLALLAVCSLTLTSCEDEEIASSLEGTWEGNTYMSASYDGRLYNSTYSYVEFSLDPFRFTRGSGYWVDYYSGATWGRDYIANHITWEVKDRIIYVHFVEDNYDLCIDNYRLSDNHFHGSIWFTKDQIFDFDLIHTSSPRWDDYYYDNPYYYAPGKDGKAQAAAERPKIMLRPASAEK